MKYIVLLGSLVLLQSCSQSYFGTGFVNESSAAIKVNSLTEKERLGYHLYFEKRLSADNSISCNTCHDITNRGNGAQSTSVATGIEGKQGTRNSPTVWNAKFLSVQFWDGRAADLAEQAKGPITNPVEMGLPNHQAAIDKIKIVPEYQTLFAKAFPSERDPVTIENLAQAIAAYESTLTTLDSPFDRGEMSRMAESGYRVFKNIGCVSCHSGPHFSGPSRAIGQGFYMKFPSFPDQSLEAKYGFMDDLGRFEVTGNESDRNMWRVPSLRNVADTAPYFHNGSVRDLREAITIMARTQLNRELRGRQLDVLEQFLKSLSGTKPEIIEPESF
jgi:cytochrome c peroxidase